MASSIDLASLDDLKQWLGIGGTDDDEILDRLITQTSRAILNVLNRPAILPVVYSETYECRNETSILLRQWPVSTILSCHIGGTEVQPIKEFEGQNSSYGYILDPTESAPPGRMQRISLRGGTFGVGIESVSVEYVAGYQIVDEHLSVPTIAPYEARVLEPHGAIACDQGVKYSDGHPLRAVEGSPSAGEYTYRDGIYRFADGDSGAELLVSYGYVPADLAHCCVEWASDRYQYRGRIGQHTKSLGSHETVTFIVKDIPDFVAAVLQPYRRVVMP